MSLLLTFLELDNLCEASMSRQACIDKLKALGKRYNFAKFSDAQIYRMWEKAEKENAEHEAMARVATKKHTCDECGAQLTDGGLCPVCDDGEEHLDEAVSSAQNDIKSANKAPQIKENKSNKETYTMNFSNVFEELSKLYESVEPETKDVAEEEAVVEEALTEAADEVPEDEPVADEEVVAEDEVPLDEPKNVILECANCGALVINPEADVAVDEDSDLANMDVPCQYCEETAGYKIVGVVAPYEAADDVVEIEDDVEEPAEDEVVEEGLLDVDVPIDVAVQANGNNVPFMNM